MSVSLSDFKSKVLCLILPKNRETKIDIAHFFFSKQEESDTYRLPLLPFSAAEKCDEKT
jgi:hypothetical protein